MPPTNLIFVFDILIGSKLANVQTFSKMSLILKFWLAEIYNVINS